MRIGRRGLWGVAAAGAARAEPAALATDLRADLGPFRPEEFGFVGVYDADWLTDARYARMLDAMAASPGGFAGVRFFGALNAGTRERDFPTASGGTWADPAQPPDFTASLEALGVLVSRGLVPFVALTFFPPAISPSPIHPPADLDGWRRLVRDWLRACAARFGAAEVSRWWLEVWNEPNMPPFWAGDWEDYFRLYRATAEAARETGLALRLGGPAIAWLPAPDIAPMMERFLRFLAANPELPCDFVSFHRKGIWDARIEAEPEVARLVEAAETVAEMALRIIPERCARGLALINNEADMRVGFQRPYRPRLTERFASWHAALAVAHAALSVRYASRGLRFWAAGDNANQHLVDEPFDGRRALLTPSARDRPADLVKLPVFHFYEMLRALGPTLVEAREERGVFSLVTRGPSGSGGRVAALATLHVEAGAREFLWAFDHLPWPRADVALFRVDGARSNSFAANGARTPSPALGRADMRRLRFAAELALDGPPARIARGAARLELRLDPYATVLALLTEASDRAPAPPRGVEAVRMGRDVLVRWRDGAAGGALGFEVLRDGQRVSPSPLLPHAWLETAPASGGAYAVRAVSAAGRRSAAVAARPVTL